MKGNKMAESALIAALFGSVAIYIIYKYYQNEVMEYNQVANTTTMVQVRVKALEKRLEDLDGLSKKVFDRVAELETDVTEVQDHCAKIRDAQISLRDKLSRKRPIIELRQPVPVEITHKPPTKTLKKAAKQIQELSK
jgi:hypothetical protein